MTGVVNPAVGHHVLLANGNRGTIRFVGTTKFAEGLWYGIELEQPIGKNNGTIQGESYFSCGENMGMFVRRMHIDMILAQAAPQPRKPTAQPAPSAHAASKKPARPASMGGGGLATRTAPKLDSAATKRLSLNAPSPSPIPRVSRTANIARVGFPKLWS